jgi:thioredoxin reductase (NADPH)
MSVATEHDVAIIGSGPAGYTAAIYCARAGLSPVVLEGVSMGGALMTTTEVENFPGFREGITGPILMEDMRGQAERFGAQLVSAEAVRVDLAAPVKTVTDTFGVVRGARMVILAMGSEYRRLGVAGEDRYSGRGVSWCATCDAAFFKGQDVAVVGGGDSAMEEALFAARFASQVTIVHRRDEFRASHIMLKRARAEEKIRFVTGAVVCALEGEQRLTGVTVRDLASGQHSTLPVRGLFEAVGHTPRSALVAGQLELDEDGYVVVQHPTTRTNVAGVFACGDLVDRHYRQAITAAGTGCVAAIDAERHLAAASAIPALSNVT